MTKIKTKELIDNLASALKKADGLLIHLGTTQEMPPAQDYVSQVRREILNILANVKVQT